MRPDVSEIPCVTSGTQKWNGVSPSFMARAEVMMMDAVGLKTFVIVHWLEYIRLMMIAIMRSMDAVAWVRKYLVEASMARGLYFFIRMGMRSEEHTSELQSRQYLVCRLLLEKKKEIMQTIAVVRERTK